MRLRAACLALCAAAAAAADPPAPIWADQFSARVHQTITYKPLGRTFANVFTYYYDAVHKLSRTDHSKGQFDEICRMVKGKENSDEPCSMIVAEDKWRYVLYPEDPAACCRVCNASAGCGIISKDWLVGSTYVGQKTVNGRVCDGWVQRGDEDNYYFATADARRAPCEYYEGYPTFDMGNNTWSYDTDGYVEGAQDPALFQVPDSCRKMCPLNPQ